MTVLLEGQLDEQRTGTALAVVLTYVDLDSLPKDFGKPQVTSVLCCTALSRPAPELRANLISAACSWCHQQRGGDVADSGKGERCTHDTDAGTSAVRYTL